MSQASISEEEESSERERPHSRDKDVYTGRIIKLTIIKSTMNDHETIKITRHSYLFITRL